MFKIYYSNFDTQVKLIFDVYDFDSDGFISPEDVRLVLSYIPMLNTKDVKTGPKEGIITQKGGGFEDFGDRINTLEEISAMVEACFGARDKLDLQEFQSIQENKTSDMLLSVLNLIREKLPCSENFYKYQAEFEKTLDGDAPRTKTKKIASPHMLRSLSPTARERKGSGDEGTESTAGSMLSKVTSEEAKNINLAQFQSAKEERMRKRRQNEEAVSGGAESGSPMGGSDFVRMANQTDAKQGGKKIWASPTAFL